MELLTSGWHGGATQALNHLTMAKDEFCGFWQFSVLTKRQ